MLATIGDGYVTLDGAKATPHSLPGQLEAAFVDEVRNTSEGTFFFENDEELPPWRLGAKGWEVASLAPPFESNEAGDVDNFEQGQKDWYETRVLVGAGGEIYTVSGSGASPGTRTTTRRIGGKPERIGRETSGLNPSDSFLTADGTLWNADFGELHRFEKGRWEIVAPLPRDGPFRLDSVSKNGPPWLLLDQFKRNLWRLEHGARWGNPRLTLVDIREGGKALHVDGAIPWSDNELLLATDIGLRAYAPSTKNLTRVQLPEPERPATRLARDRLGRFWLGGKSGLSMVAPGQKTPETFDGVPWLGRNEVRALSPDPQRDDGVIVALGRRGVAFVRARRRS